MKVGVIIGRFQPLHKGHLLLIEKALKEVDELVFIVGSIQNGRTLKNPFLMEEIYDMIMDCVDYDKIRSIYSIRDILYDNDRWLNQVKETIKECIDNDNDEFIIFGDNELYSELGYEYKQILCPQTHNYFILHDYYKKGKINDCVICKHLLKKFMLTDDYLDLKIEYIKIYNDKVNICTNAMIICNQHFLMLKRKDNRRYALPGDYVKFDETLFDGCIRQVFEQSSLELTKNNVLSMAVFDAVERSDFGRVISNCYFFLVNADEFEKIKLKPLSSDILEAKWVHYNDLKHLSFHEDHYSIIYHGIRLLE